MQGKIQRYCVWLGFSFGPLLCLGLMISGFFIPPSPSLSAAEIASMFHDGQLPIRIGIWICTAASPLLAFYVAALSKLIKQIHGEGSTLATVQTVAGTCIILEFIFPQMVWQTAAFRLDRSPELLLMLNDVAWLCYVGVVGTAVAQMLVLAVTFLTDPHDQPLVPRWCAYLCLWSAIGVTGGSLCIFFQSGPLAWNGIIAWWLLVVSFFAWMVTMCAYMHKVSPLLDQPS